MAEAYAAAMVSSPGKGPQNLKLQSITNHCLMTIGEGGNIAMDPNDVAEIRIRRAFKYVLTC